MLKTTEDQGWSICLASEWPRIVDEIDVLAEKRVSISTSDAIKLAQMCQERLKMDGAYFKRTCSGCLMRHRLNLECLN